MGARITRNHQGDLSLSLETLRKNAASYLQSQVGSTGVFRGENVPCIVNWMQPEPVNHGQIQTATPQGATVWLMKETDEPKLGDVIKVEGYYLRFTAVNPVDHGWLCTAVRR